MNKQNILGGIEWAKVIEKVRKERSGVEHMAKEDWKVGRKGSDHEKSDKFDIANNRNSIFSVFKLILWYEANIRRWPQASWKVKSRKI